MVARPEITIIRVHDAHAYWETLAESQAGQSSQHSNDLEARKKMMRSNYLTGREKAERKKHEKLDR